MRNLLLHLSILTFLFTVGTATEITTKKPFDSYKNNSVTKNLGFIQKTRTIKLAKKIESSTVNINVKISSDKSLYDIELQKFDALIKDKMALPMFTTNSPNSKALAKSISPLKTKVRKLMTRMLTMTKYLSANKDPFVNSTCKIEIDFIPLEEFQGAYLETHWNLDYLNNSVMEPNLLVHKNEIVYFIYGAETAIDNLLEYATERLTLIENLQSHVTGGQMPMLLHLNPCHGVFSMDNLDIELCETYESGLSCLINLNSHTETETLNMYTLINYDGVEISLGEPENFLAKNKDGHFFILNCIDNEKSSSDLDEFEQCNQQPFDNKCTEHLESKDHFYEVLQNCNFTFAKSEDIVRFADGILIQTKVLTLKELHPNTFTTINILPTRTPVVITTNALLSVTYNRQLNIRPEKVYDSRNLDYTWLSKEQIMLIHSKAAKERLLKSIELDDYIDMAYGVFLLLLTPGSVYAIKLCISSGLFKKGCCKLRKQKPNKTNYKINKGVLKRSPNIALTSITNA